MHISIKIIVSVILIALAGYVAIRVFEQPFVSESDETGVVDVVNVVTTDSIEVSAEQESTPPLVVKNIPILVYHSIAPKPTHNESAMQKRFRIDPENFRAQMQYLADNNYTPITFAHLADYLLHDVAIPEKPVVLTFDDGTLNQYNYAFPILEEFGFDATFFIYPGVTGHHNFMNWEQLGELVAAGHEIGSHTIIHYNLTTIDEETLRNELVGSKQKLEEKLGITVTTLAYPHYAENETVRAAVADAGYVAARAGWRDVVNSADEILHLKAQEAKNVEKPF